MHRRNFLLSTLAAPALFGAKRIDLSRISLLTDEIARTPGEAMAFAKQYGIQWVELRGVPGGGGTYAFLEEDKLRAVAQELKDAGLRVSFLNTPMLKFTLPGTEPARKRVETEDAKTKRLEREKQQFERRIDDLRKAIRAAHIFGVKGVRVFTFSRVAEPESVMPRIAQVIDEMVAIAQKEGIELLVENEASCNVATCAELKRICELVPRKGFGINWDPVNALNSKEKPFPDGYALLPKKRIHNVQMKARALVIGPDFIDWGGVFQALVKDGYKGKIGLETHVFDGTLIEKSHLCMKKIQELVK
ncbi:MAG: sugar phosphate isomerase/epimerase [Bryobacterales bacterium]|nr:sugar phosphate isomerase/epimerase [Bryobacterales bacterium]